MIRQSSSSPCILAIDTATGPCSVAVWHNGRIAAYLEHTQLPVMQSACLLPMVEEALAQSGIAYSDLSAVAATIGPGSFTGIRVALAAARGIAFASSIATLGFTTLEVMAYAARPHAASSGRILAILNAGKNEYYYQFFANSSPRRGEVRRGAQFGTDSAQHAPTMTLPLMGREYYAGEPRVGTLEETLAAAGSEPVTVAGNTVIKAEHFITCPVYFPRADALSALAAEASDAAQTLTPFYIRAPDAKLPIKNA